MLLRSLTWLVLFVVLAGCGESAQKPAAAPAAGLEALTVHETHARDFEFDGVSFKTTEAEFRQSSRIIKEQKAVKAFENLATLKSFGFQSEAADHVVVDFFEGQLVNVIRRDGFSVATGQAA